MIVKVLGVIATHWATLVDTLQAVAVSEERAAAIAELTVVVCPTTTEIRRRAMEIRDSYIVKANTCTLCSGRGWRYVKRGNVEAVERCYCWGAS